MRIAVGLSIIPMPDFSPRGRRSDPIVEFTNEIEVNLAGTNIEKHKKGETPHESLARKIEIHPHQCRAINRLIGELNDTIIDEAQRVARKQPVQVTSLPSLSPIHQEDLLWAAFCEGALNPRISTSRVLVFSDTTNRRPYIAPSLLSIKGGKWPCPNFLKPIDMSGDGESFKNVVGIRQDFSFEIEGHPDSNTIHIPIPQEYRTRIWTKLANFYPDEQLFLQIRSTHVYSKAAAEEARASFHTAGEKFVKRIFFYGYSDPKTWKAFKAKRLPLSFYDKRYLSFPEGLNQSDYHSSILFNKLMTTVHAHLFQRLKNYYFSQMVELRISKGKSGTIPSRRNLFTDEELAQELTDLGRNATLKASESYESIVGTVFSLITSAPSYQSFVRGHDKIKLYLPTSFVPKDGDYARPLTIDDVHFTKAVAELNPTSEDDKDFKGRFCFKLAVNR